MNETLSPRSYAELRAIAGQLLKRAPSDFTLTATGMVHEALLRLMQRKEQSWTSRGDFVAYASKAIRSVLVDHARRRLAVKRGGGARGVSLADQAASPYELTDDGLLELNEALEDLRQLSERQHRVVELRFFGQLSVAETAAAMDVSAGTVATEWRCARAWLRRRLRR